MNKTGWGGVLVLLAVLLNIPMGCGERDKCINPIELIEQVVGAEDIQFPMDAENIKIAQGFKHDDDFILHNVSFFIKKEGDPQGDLQISIHEANAGEPDDSIISGGVKQTKSATDIGESVSKITINFLSRPELKANRSYFIVVEFSPNTDNLANHFIFNASIGSDQYSEGQFLRFDIEEDKWIATSITEDLNFEVEGCEPTNQT